CPSAPRPARAPPPLVHRRTAVHRGRRARDVPGRWRRGEPGEPGCGRSRAQPRAAPHHRCARPPSPAPGATAPQPAGPLDPAGATNAPASAALLPAAGGTAAVVVAHAARPPEARAAHRPCGGDRLPARVHRTATGALTATAGAGATCSGTGRPEKP